MNITFKNTLGYYLYNISVTSDTIDFSLFGVCVDTSDGIIFQLTEHLLLVGLLAGKHIFIFYSGRLEKVDYLTMNYTR